MFLKKCWLSLPDMWIRGEDMSKRTRRGKTETFALPVAGKVAVVAIAVAALGYGLLSRPVIVQPVRKQPARQVVLPPSSTPARIPAPALTSTPALASTPVPQVHLQTAVDDVPGRLVRQVVDYVSHEAPGTVVIDTGNTFLYLVLNGGQAMRYGIGVGREGFAWSGEQVVARKSEWPDWRPPADMLSRQPYLPRFMAGGLGNPLGARAMYLGETEYRIHGTNKPDTIGKRVSSGCIRLTNEDVADLYERVKIGAKVIVLPASRPSPAAQRPLQGAPADAAFRSPDPVLLPNRPST
jgi:lipoprotein-anchoring transpeptidase ErfK/SrfK